MKKAIHTLIILGTFAVFMASSVVTSYALTDPGTSGGTNSTNTTSNDCNTSILPCDLDIAGMLHLVINILSGLIGVAAVGSLVYAGILYTTASGDTEKTKKAIEWIRNTVIGIVAYAFMYLILNFVIPGGFAF